MNHIPNTVNVAARVTMGALPNICMLLILGTIGTYLWGQYQLNVRMAHIQSGAIEAAIVEGRMFHHREGRLIRRIAIEIGVPTMEVDKILPESTLSSDSLNKIDAIAKPAWFSF